MTIRRLNPPQLQPQQGLTHVVEVTGGRTLYLSGQGAYDSDNQIVVAGDHYAQARQAFANVCIALEAAGATFADVVKATYYVVGLDDEVLGQFARALYEVPGVVPEQLPASTMVGVETLAFPEMLIEIDVTAVVPVDRSDTP